MDAVGEHFLTTPIAGMTVAVTRGGTIAHLRGYGVADLATGAAAGPETVYEIGSITKTFTAAAILRLVEQGRLGLEDPVARYFPELAEAAPGVTLRHLLSHTSGLDSAPVTDELDRPATEAEILAALSRPREGEPGARYRYNNAGYMLLGLLVERVAGEPWSAHLRKTFFEPLGLSHTAPCGWPAELGRARGYVQPVDGDPTPRPHAPHHPGASFSAGALCSTAGDLLSWQSALAEGRAVSPASYALMTTPAPLTGGGVGRYGLGLFVDGEGEGLRHHHGGAASGFITQMAWYPADRTGVVVLTNGVYAGAIAEQIEAALASSARGHAYAPPIDLPLEPAERERLVGRYRVGPTTLTVYEHQGRLRAQPEGQVSARLLHQGGGRFVAEHDPRLMVVFGPEPLRAETLELSIAGRALPKGARVEP